MGNLPIHKVDVTKRRPKVSGHRSVPALLRFVPNFAWQMLAESGLWSSPIPTPSTHQGNTYDHIHKGRVDNQHCLLSDGKPLAPAYKGSIANPRD